MSLNTNLILLLALSSSLGCSSKGDPEQDTGTNSDAGETKGDTSDAPKAGNSDGSETGDVLDEEQLTGTGGTNSTTDPGTGGTDAGTGGTTDTGEAPGAGTSPCDPNAVEVDSLAALLPYLDDDNANVKLAPGTYRITPDVVDSTFPDPTLFSVTGSDSTYCFTGATIEFETEIFQSFGNINVTELFVGGSGNTLKNLTMTDIGMTRPTRSALGVQIDGTGNVLEGFHMTVRGSQPYAYGDIFGKGSGYAIKHFKHSAILLTGTDTELRDTTIIHRSYGHGIFMQGAIGVLIEGIYLEGELRTTDEVLAEEGNEAADRDFLTVWGWPLRPGYRFSLQEDGIRAYRRATNGRITSDVTIRDSTVKFMRSGVTIGLGEGQHHVENVTSLGNESGFWAGNNADIVGCRGDTSVGPLYSDDVNRSGNSVELTLLDNVVPKIGNTPSVHIAGRSANFVLKDGTTTFDDSIELLVGGPRHGHRYDEAGTTTEATGITIDNQTPYPLVLGPISTNNDVTSCGPVTDEGTDNDVNETTCP